MSVLSVFKSFKNALFLTVYIGFLAVQHPGPMLLRSLRLTVTSHGDQRTGYRGVLYHVRRFAVVLQTRHAPLESVSRVYVLRLALVQLLGHATCRNTSTV